MLTPQTKSAIALANGDFFDFKNPRGHSFCIKTIARALSNLCRYTGHVNKFYSVAEHSVLVSRLVPERYAFEGLMHDASEAYCGDVASPLKRLIPQYKKIEDSVQEALAIFYGFQYPFPPEIHEADKQLYLSERNTIANCGTDALWFTDMKPADIEIVGLNPKRAEQLFLERYEELTKDGKGYESVLKKRTKRSSEAQPLCA